MKKVSVERYNFKWEDNFYSYP